jgi:hypothetical protein
VTHVEDSGEALDSPNSGPGMTGDATGQYVQLPIYREELARALDFGPSDIEANRAGRLSDSQTSSQYRVMERAVVLAAVCAVLTGLSVIVAFIVGVATGLGVAVLLLGGAFAAFVGLFVRYNVPLWRDVDARVVSSVEGTVRAGEKETDIRSGPFITLPIWSYYWTVGDTERFWVSGKAYAALTPARHRVYFLPRSRKVVAAEPVSVAAG